jgi:hypothetical protein
VPRTPRSWCCATRSPSCNARSDNPGCRGPTGDPGRSHPAAARRAPPSAVPDRHPSHAPALARRAGQASLDLPAPNTRPPAHRPGDPPPRTGDGPATTPPAVAAAQLDRVRLKREEVPYGLINEYRRAA